KEEVKTPPAPPKTAPPKMQPKPEPSSNINKIITIALAILVLGGIVWAFYPTGQKQVEITLKPTATPEITRTPVQTISTPTPEVTPTGNKTRVKLDSRRGFIPNTKTIKLGDEIIWENSEAETVTLVSNNELFAEQILPYGRRANHTFKKTGTYSFNLKGKDLAGTITVEP
ncbi:MAG: hypothetical protein Q8N79_08730, partial [Candidatus Methanoperedens sp.]|nr:hypothetical protein [Candidatus Methanoperedens sp.]